MPSDPIPPLHPTFPRQPRYPWELTLTDLRALPPPLLATLVSRWLAKFGAEVTQTCRTPGPFTCEATLGQGGTERFRVRVYQRQHRLQPHHIEGFVGHLVRHGLNSGILVTTGEITWDAVLIAQPLKSPRVTLYSGHEWVAELAARRVGLKRRSIWRWFVDTTSLIQRPRRKTRRSRR